MIMQNYYNNWNQVSKEQSTGIKISVKSNNTRQNQYLDYLIDHSFLGINRLLEDNALRTAHIGYFLLKLERRDYNVMTDGRNFFDQPVKKL